jgi:hypothetical protein
VVQRLRLGPPSRRPIPHRHQREADLQEPLRPDWQYVADGIESIPVSQEDVVFPCALEAGTYPYEVSMFGGPGGMDNPQFQLSSTLVVE